MAEDKKDIYVINDQIVTKNFLKNCVATGTYSINAIGELYSKITSEEVNINLISVHELVNYYIENIKLKEIFTFSKGVIFVLLFLYYIGVINETEFKDYALTLNKNYEQSEFLYSKINSIDIDPPIVDTPPFVEIDDPSTHLQDNMQGGG